MDWIEPLDCQGFRQQLAGLASTDVMYYEPEKFKELGIRLGFVMAKLFNRNVLEATTLWERIGNGIRTAAAKVGNGDTDYFMNLCLEFVMAEDVRVASDDDCGALILELSQQEEPFRRQWIRYLHDRVFVITTFARQQWMQYRDRDTIETAYKQEAHAI